MDPRWNAIRRPRRAIEDSLKLIRPSKKFTQKTFQQARRFPSQRADS